MVRVRCSTNLDDYQRENWPEEMFEIPKIGDLVMAESGRVLRVCCITHSMAKDYQNRDMGYSRKPIVLVELNRLS